MSSIVRYLLGDFILVFMFLRVFFIVRALFNYNIYQDMYSTKLCRSYGFTANTRFSYKCMLKTRPGFTLRTTMFLSVVVLAYCLRIFELQYYTAISRLDFENYFSAIWCVFITMTTVGYGDFFPVTFFGRIVCMISALWGTFLISMFIIVAQ